MDMAGLRTSLDTGQAGQRMHKWVRDWYPICRSISGSGLRETLRRIGKLIPLNVTEVPTGTPVFDWTIPREWVIREAWIKDPAGRRVVDFDVLNLHVMGYSVPVHCRLSLEDLKQYCYTLPDQPDRIPYRTSYYKEQWGFCLAQNTLDALEPGTYEVYIDSELRDGALSYGEFYLPGRVEYEVFLSAHTCHPSLANDNLSGIAVAVCLAELLQKIERRLSYRIVFAPGTIGAISWLAQHEAETSKIAYGLVLACLGDPGPLSYKKSRRSDAAIDQAVTYMLSRVGGPFNLYNFRPYGYDERQYCSPGFNLPVGCLMRSRPGFFPEYHTNADNPDFVRPECLADSLSRLIEVLEVLEGNSICENLKPKCEPQLGKRGLYGAIGGRTETKSLEMALLWVLSYSDGQHTLLDIANRSQIPFPLIREAADTLLKTDLLREISRD